MKLGHRTTTVIALASVYAFAAAPAAQGALLLHWELDEANGNYTSGGYREEVSGNTSNSFEVITGTDVTEGQTGIAPGGGTSVRFGTAGADTYINAGSMENTGTYVSSPATTPFVLGNNHTISAWFNASALGGDRIILSNQFNSNTGFLFGLSGSNVLMDFGNTRASYSAGVVADQDYFLVVRQDLDGDTNHGWAAGSNHRISLYNPTTNSWQHFDGTQQKTGTNLQNLSIGRFTNGGREWDGLIDDVRVYNHTLSQGDLDALAIPEPGSLALLGIAGLCALRRRRS